VYTFILAFCMWRIENHVYNEMCCNLFAFANYLKEKFTTDGCLL
jgi:hypothetical protein